MDEVLTPDSSRFWPPANVVEGSNPPSLDKQPVRDWLEQVQVDGAPWNKKPPPPPMPAEVVDATAARYRAALDALAWQKLARAALCVVADWSAHSAAAKLETRVPRRRWRRDREHGHQRGDEQVGQAAVVPKTPQRGRADGQGCRTRRCASRSTPSACSRRSRDSGTAASATLTLVSSATEATTLHRRRSGGVPLQRPGGAGENEDAESGHGRP